jgi:hypothetical protein
MAGALALPLCSKHKSSQILKTFPGPPCVWNSRAQNTPTVVQGQTFRMAARGVRLPFTATRSSFVRIMHLT